MLLSLQVSTKSISILGPLLFSFDVVVVVAAALLLIFLIGLLLLLLYCDPFGGVYSLSCQ